MKKNSQSIDGFIPRRRVNSLDGLRQESRESSNFNKKNVKEKKRQKIEEVHNKPEDIEMALQNLEIEEVQENERKEREASKKRQKFLRKLEKKNSKRNQKGKKPLTEGQFRFRRNFSRISLFVIIGLGILFIPMIYQALSSLSKIANNGNLLGALVEEKKLKTDTEGRTNILIFGTSPKGWEGEELTDSIMVASVNQSTNKIYTVSLPRDLYVKHSCKTWLGTSAGKLNETYGCGYHNAKNSGSSEEDSEKAGQKLLADKAKEILGLDIQYVVHGNWQVLVDTINSVGGIDVLVEAYDGSSRVYDVATKINYKSGQTYHMDGQAALAFSRARGSEGGVGLSNSNFDRERNQQKILKATVAKVNEKKIDPLVILNLINALGNNVQTSFDISELKTAASLAQKFNSNGVSSLPLVNENDASGNYFTSENIGGASSVVPKAGTYDYNKIKAYIAKNTLGSDVLSENAKIVILNGTTYSGLASKEQENLEKEGYNISGIDSAPNTNWQKTKVFYVKKGEKSATIKKLESKYSTTAEELPSNLSNYSNNSDIIIVLGEN